MPDVTKISCILYPNQPVVLPVNPYVPPVIV